MYTLHGPAERKSHLTEKNLNEQLLRLQSSRLVEVKEGDDFVTHSYKLLTTLIYKSKRHPLDKELWESIIRFLREVYLFYKQGHDHIRSRKIERIVKAFKAGNQEASLVALSSVLENIEKEHHDYYGSFLSDDSDNDDEAKFDEKTAEGECLIKEAKKYQEKAEYKKLFVGNNPKAKLKDQVPSSKATSVYTRLASQQVDKEKLDEIKAGLDKLNAALRKKVPLKTALKELGESKFFLVQFRGIHYRTTEWGQIARQRHRQLDERGQPLYSASVASEAKAYPFHKHYKLSEEERRRVEEKMPAIAATLKNGLLVARKS